MKPLLLQIPLWILVFWLWTHLRSLKRRGRRSPFNEKILRLPAFTIRNFQRDTALDGVLGMMGVFVMPYVTYAMLTGSVLVDRIVMVIGALVTAYFLFKSIKNLKLAIQLHLGVEAETHTGQELNFLMRDGAWVFHDIPYQYGNIDHVIISTGGVFAVETKGISKPTNAAKTGAENATLSVNGDAIVLPHGRTSAHTNQAKVHAKWLREEIQRRFGASVPVRAVVAIPGWMINGGFDGDCWVVNPKRGNSLRAAVTKQAVDPQLVSSISAWIEDLARSMTPKSKEFDGASELTFR